MAVGILSSWIILLCLLNINSFKKNIPILIINILLIAVCEKFDKEICLKLVSISNILTILIHNHKFKSSCILYITVISTGFLMLTIQKLNPKLLSMLLTNLNSDNLTILINEIYTLIAIILIIGFIPFSEQIMYLFSVSSIMFKISTFIIPMYISLQMFQDLAQVFSTDSFKILGTAICFYSGICFAFSNNFKIIVSNIIVYFYGLQIVFLAQTKTLIFFPLWLIMTALMLLICSVYAPKRISKYNIRNIKEYIFSNDYGIIFFIVFAIIFISTFLNSILVLNLDKYNIVLSSITFYFFGKIIHFLFKKKITSSSAKTMNSGKILPKKTPLICLFFLTISLCLFAIQAYIKNYILFIIKPLHSTIGICAIFIATIILGFILAHLKQHHFLIIKTYSNTLRVVMRTVKIIYLVLESVVIDFFDAIKKTIINFFIPKTLEKLSNILYNNNAYFYALFLIEIIIILIIEFIIL